MEWGNMRSGGVENGIIMAAYNAKVNGHHAVTYHMPTLKDSNRMYSLCSRMQDPEQGSTVPSTTSNKLQKILSRNVYIVNCKII
jgi:hypothetical protein